MQKIGRYAIEREIGRGEMGVVYLAMDPVLDRRVALKTVRILDGLDEAEQAEYPKRFYREAQAAGKLSHPGIITIYDAGMDEATRSHFMAMEYVAGVSLKQLLADGPRLAPRQAAFIAAGVAEALDYAHAHGVVHRDVKPANIMLTERGAVKIADFGLAKVPTSHLTMEGTYLGTPAYTSPEQVLGRPVTGPSDLFSLGIVLYELLAGRKPFPAENLGQLFHAIAFDPHPTLSEVMPGCPAELEAITNRALQKDIGDRYVSGADMARDLRAFLGVGTDTLHGLVHPPNADSGAVFDEPTVSAENPLSDLITYLEKTTQRLAPKEEAVEGRTTPTTPPRPILRPRRPVFVDRALRGLTARPRWAWLAQDLPARAFWIFAGAAALAAAIGVGALKAEAWKQFPPGMPPPTISPIPSWRSEIRTGMADLNAGKTEQALARLQGIRLRHPASPLLSSLINGAIARLQESMKTDQAPAEQVRRLLALGQEASKRGDTLSAAEFIQAAFSVAPANPEATAAEQVFAPRLEAPPAPEAAASTPTLRLVFDSPTPQGYIMAQVDGVQVLRKEFAFNGKSASESGIYGRLEERVAATSGRHRIQMWITVKHKESYTAYGFIDGTIRPNGGAILVIRLDEAKKKLILTLDS